MRGINYSNYATFEYTSENIPDERNSGTSDVHIIHEMLSCIGGSAIPHSMSSLIPFHISAVIKNIKITLKQITLASIDFVVE